MVSSNVEYLAKEADEVVFASMQDESSLHSIYTMFANKAALL